MKRSLRIIIFVAALAILTAALCADTLSNYINKENKQDSATVSKFGVVIRISDESAFETAYRNPTDDQLTVSSTAQTVAPGTKDRGGVLITVTGTPSVKTRLKFDLKIRSDVFYQTEDTDYHPLVFTFSRVADENGAITPEVLKTGTLAEISAYMENEFPNTALAEHAPETDLTESYRLNWYWAYEAGEQAATYDTYDTILGDIAAGGSAGDGLVAGTDYSITVDYALTVTVMQIQ